MSSASMLTAARGAGDEKEAEKSFSRTLTSLPFCPERWRKLVDEMENLGQHPEVRPEDIEEARERLAGLLLGRVQIVPEDGHFVAEVGLQSLEIENPARGRASHIPMVAGACNGSIRRGRKECG